MSCAEGCSWVTCYGAETCVRCGSVRTRDAALLLDMEHADHGYPYLTEDGAEQLIRHGRDSCLFHAVAASETGDDSSCGPVAVLAEAACVALGGAAIDYDSDPDHLPFLRLLTVYARAFAAACNLDEPTEDP